MQLTKKEIMYNVRLKREIDRLERCKRIYKCDDNDIAMYNRLIKQLKELLK